MAYCQRFFTNCRSPKPARTVGRLTTKEYDLALKSLVRLSQQTAFHSELQNLQRKPRGQSSLKDAQFKSPLKNLDIILDSAGMLRLNSRLARSPGSYDSRYPMLLPANHHLSNLIARSIHHQTLHAGPTQLHATIKQRFWPIRGRNLARRTVHRCVTCFRCRPKASNQYMAPLPANRITPAKVFEHTGLDYCGPFLVRQLAGRGASVKVWVAVYVCFAVKAVVLDIVAGMPASACVNSLRRFVSRVGRVRVIHCDNSTSFIGAFRDPAFWLPEPDYSSIPVNRLSHFQMTQRATTDLWKRWSKEYIGLLHHRPAKWRKTPTDFKIGDMVVVKNDNAPPKQWPLGRIVAVYPNKDNIVRVVDVRTPAGIRRRATTELCLLPIDDNPGSSMDSTNANQLDTGETASSSVH